MNSIHRTGKEESSSSSKNAASFDFALSMICELFIYQICKELRELRKNEQTVHAIHTVSCH